MTEEIASTNAQREDNLKVQVVAAMRVLKAHDAAEHLIPFVEFVSPDPDDYENPDASTYKAASVHRIIAEALEEVASGKCLRLLLSVPPQHGKSELCSRKFPAWFAGKFPWKHTILASYSADLAEGFGDDVRNLLNQAEYQQVFPKVSLRKGGKAKDHMVTIQGGKLSFIGRGGAGSGKPADLLIIDDIIKDAKEAESKTIRDDCWEWFTKVAYARCHAASAIIIIMCMTGDTPVMLADGTEKPLRDIRPGDEVATYKDGILSTSIVKNWISNGLDSVFEIKTTSGRIVKANERHPFLVFDNGELKWIRTKDLRRGQKIVRVNGESGKVRPVRGKAAISRLCAEGTAHRITTRNDGQTGFDRLLSILSHGAKRALNIATESLRKNINDFLPNRAGSVRSVGSRQETMCAHIGVENSASIIATTQEKSGRFSVTTATLLSGMQKLRKLLLRQPDTSDFILDEIVDVTAAGIEEVFDVQIENTENFIANGLVSHNTRWHEDDLIGRLTNPKNPKYDPDEAKKWTYINIPAILTKNEKKLADALGIKLNREGEAALWPQRFPLHHLRSAQRLNPIGFSALYMGKPTPPEGTFYKRNMLFGYKLHELPRDLRHYGSCDLAVSTERDRDRSVIMNWGLDEYDCLWLLPEIYWGQKNSDQLVDTLIDFAKRYGWMDLFGEKGQIDRAIRPFLEKRMLEEGCYFNMTTMPTVGNKGARSLSMRGRMAQGKVRFPTFAPWWMDAEEEILNFTGSGGDMSDDFCDALALPGAALQFQVAADKQKQSDSNVVQIGTIRWIKEQSAIDRRNEKTIMARKGF